MLKNPITLGQLLQYIDYECESIQIADENSWDVYSVIPACCTFILKRFADWKVECLAAVGENIIRVGLIEPKYGERWEKHGAVYIRTATEGPIAVGIQTSADATAAAVYEEGTIPEKGEENDAELG